MKRTFWALSLALFGSLAHGFPFTVLHTNDLHSHFEGAGPDALFTAAPDGDPVQGHYARLATAIRLLRQEKQARGEPVLLVDAGDFFSGSLIHTLAPRTDTPLIPELEFFHTLGYDAVSLGNHEFDGGEAGLSILLDKARAKWGDTGPLVLSNVVRPSPLDSLPQEKIVEIRHGQESLRVGFLGLIGTDAARVSAGNRNQVHLVGYDDKKSKEKLKELVALTQKRARALHKEQKADLVIVLLHGGDPEDKAIAKAKGVDLVIAGHSHQLYETPHRSANKWIAQAGSYGQYLGVLELETGPKGLALRNQGNTYRKIDDKITADPAVLGQIALYKNEVDRALAPTGQSYATPATLITQGIEREALANQVATGILAELNRNATKPFDFYFTSLSLIREAMPAVRPAGTPYQFSDIFRVLSIGFGDHFSPGSPIVSATMTVRDFLKLLDLIEVYRWMSPHFKLAFSDSLQLKRRGWGLPFVNRFSEVLLNGKDIHAHGPTVRVATNAYAGAFFPKLDSMSHGLVKVELRDVDGQPMKEFHREEFPSEPFLFARHLQRMPPPSGTALAKPVLGSQP